MNLLDNYLYLIEICATKKILKKQQQKKCKYEYTMNMIPKPLGIK